jgi:hypothetical protein
MGRIIPAKMSWLFSFLLIPLNILFLSETMSNHIPPMETSNDKTNTLTTKGATAQKNASSSVPRANSHELSFLNTE